jgi:uncharacterized protein YdeI (BOF family)
VVTISELLQNPEQYNDAVVSISGIATSLSSEKFLLNDGTGQILVELEDEESTTVSVDGLSISVVGKFDDKSSSLSPEVEAFTITYQGQVIYQANSLDDDMDDDGDNSGDDDMDDDDDDMDDDDMDDDSGDSDDDSGDDSGGDESGSHDGGSDDDSGSSDDSHGSSDSDD